MKELKVYSWNEFLQGELKLRKAAGRTAVSIGVFDGIHRGHEELVRHITGQKDLFPWIITFEPNPSRIFDPNGFPGDLMSSNQKLNKFASLGIEAIVIIDFSREFGTLRGAEFLARVCDAGNVQYLAVGEDFHCGHNMDTAAWAVKSLLESRSVRVDIVPPVSLDAEIVSSTRIRKSVLIGDFASAEKCLGHPYELDLVNLPVLTEEGGSLLERSALRQVVPEKGTFTVVLKGPSGEKKGILDIDERCLSWNSSGIVHAITFTHYG